MKRFVVAAAVLALAACAPPDPAGARPENAATTMTPVAAAAALRPPSGATVLWVDPRKGRDAAAGGRAAPLRTVAEAWRRIPMGRTLIAPVWVMLRKGVYPQTNTPVYWEKRWGTATAPIVLQAADGARSAVFRGDINAFDVRHLTVRGVAIKRSGDAFHCEECSWVTLRSMRLSGRGAAHETIKVNQSDHITIMDSNVSGAYENAIDFVAVQYATIRHNRIHGSGDWCAYVKGGSAYVSVLDNRIYDCGTGGFTAGQGTGFEYMVAPWLQYETYGVTVMFNRIWDTEGAGLGVNGGYNTVMAFNTMYRVGSRSHVVEFVHGSRSCDGDTAACRRNRELGGWGGAGIDGQFIPSRNTYFLNNVVLNPAGYRSAWQQFQVDGALDPPAGSGVPAPSRVDDNLVIRGNVIRNGDQDMPTGLADDTALLRANWINTVTPDLVAPASGDFRPVAGGRLARLAPVGLPAMTWTDSGGVPAGAVPTIPGDHPPGALLP